MSVFENLVNMYSTVDEQPVDEQIVLLCKSGYCDALPASIVLAQYKFCLNHDVRGEAFNSLKKYLEMLSSEDAVKRLEVV